MPAQGNPTRIKTALDTEVCNKVIELERDFNRTLPSGRIAHNYRWKVDCAIRRAELNPDFMLLHGEHFMQVVNSYNGLLKWCNAYRLRREVFERLKASPWRRVFYFHDDFHVTLQPHATPIGQFIRRNKQRKKGQSKWPR